MSNTINEILKELTLFRNQYFNKVQSWGRADADKWWETQVVNCLNRIAEVVREEERESIMTAYRQATGIKDDIFTRAIEQKVSKD